LKVERVASKLAPTTDPSPTGIHLRTAALLALALLLAACTPTPRPRTPEQVRAQIVRLMPARVPDRAGWAADIQAAFAALKLEPSDENLCATLAVTAQESTFVADPEVPRLGAIAVGEIERRAAARHVPKFLVRAALELDSPDGRTYAQRLERVRTERQLSELYEEMIAQVPMGSRLLAGANPVHTGGPMQVSIAFAQQHARSRKYPYALPAGGTIRHEVFTRRGGLYFGIAHLLGYRTSYESARYRFADYNAGFYASRNAAFQQAVSHAAGIPLVPDGDLVLQGGKRDAVGATEAAVRRLGPQLQLDDAQIARALRQGDRLEFERTALYRGVFALADARTGRHLPRAVVPRIELHSPKINRQLTTQWFVDRVDRRYQQCLAQASRP
jgi:hypothetical protein